MTFFTAETEDLDIPTIKKHAERLARAGLAGLVTMGSNGEAVHCTREEKVAVTKATREALDAAGFPQMPIIVGATEGSVRGTVELIKLLQPAGGDYVLLLPPSYYRPHMDTATIVHYFRAVADASPLPVIIYSYPGAVAGIDVDSDLLIELAAHANIVGTKFTCGNTGKMTRVAAAAAARVPGHDGSGYMALGGMCDFVVPTLVSGGSGIIGGSANVMPKLSVRVWDLWVRGEHAEALRLQKVLAHGDYVLTKAAVPGTKRAIEAYFGYGGHPRAPLKRLDDKTVAKIAEDIKEAMEVENSL
ncbi:hypothetical protein P8C59_001586 [Phyllachora maydis]|uniref:Dihydrodipicolinate synthase n=1 Tax=Phyllachora maydis TaxID=1825666 RepID=A0AAD9I018_9PEZI|nr:hypothetical protein P8C59_001586 [Phyllachora maydis]